MKQKICLVYLLLSLVFIIGQTQAKSKYVCNVDDLSGYCTFWDNGKHTVLIRLKTDYIIPSKGRGNGAENILLLIADKERWQEENPQKKIVAMTTVTCSEGSIFFPGLLISYEIQK